MSDARQTEILESRFSTTTLAHTAVTVGATTTKAADANTSRKYLLLINDSDEAIYIKFGANAVMNEGIRLDASGGVFEMDTLIDTRQVNSICTTGSKTLLVSEG